MSRHRSIGLICLVLCFLFAAALLGDEVAPVPPAVASFNSGTRVVREVSEALTGTGRSILECYPWGSRTFLSFVSLFPSKTRISLIEWGMRQSVGRPPEEAARLQVSELPRWCVRQYPADDRQYDAIVIGSPSGAVAHLAALLGAPFLTTLFGLTFRHPTIDAEDHHAYIESARSVVGSILAVNPTDGFELIAHYDPMHDRSLVEVIDFIRVKFTEMPSPYAEYILRHLAPGGRLIVIDCAYTWPQVQWTNRAFLQIGGLGDMSPETYAERWPLGQTPISRRESEWGCPDQFAASVVQFAAAHEIDMLRIDFDHPWELSLVAYDAYLACKSVRDRLLLIDSFNHINPRTNLVVGIPSLWLPFNTIDGMPLVNTALQDREFDRILFAPLPSFADSPDTASIAPWVDRLSLLGMTELLGVRPRLYPADPLAPFRFFDQMAELRNDLRLDASLHLDIDALIQVIEKRNAH